MANSEGSGKISGDTLRALAEVQQRKSAERQRELEDLRRQLADNQEQLKKALEQNQTYLAELREVWTTVPALESERDELRRQLEGQSSPADQSEEEVRLANERAAHAENKLQRAITEMADLERELQAELKQAKESARQAQDGARLAQQQAAQAEEQLQRTLAELSELKSRAEKSTSAAEAPEADNQSSTEADLRARLAQAQEALVFAREEALRQQAEAEKKLKAALERAVEAEAIANGGSSDANERLTAMARSMEDLQSQLAEARQMKEDDPTFCGFSCNVRKTVTLPGGQKARVFAFRLQPVATAAIYEAKERLQKNGYRAEIGSLPQEVDGYIPQVTVYPDERTSYTGSLAYHLGNPIALVTASNRVIDLSKR